MQGPMSDSPLEFSEQNDSLTPRWDESAEREPIEGMAETEPNADLSPDELVASEPFVGRWNKLVSTTNWEKGKIIAEWRTEIIERNADLEDRTDEAWSRLVGDVSPQHVGRLRRVYGRFGDAQADYQGLYWSHFLAAMDWDDAEMWLEGALREKWSIKQMQAKRFETITATRLPQGEISHETISRDEATEAAKTESREHAESGKEFTSDSEESSGPAHEGPDFGEEPTKAQKTPESALGGEYADVAGAPGDPDAPPLYWQEMPADLAESFEAAKLAIIKHKLGEWAQVSREAVLTNLEILARIARGA